MAKSSSNVLQQLIHWQQEGAPPSAEDAVRQALVGETSRIVAKAAQIAEEQQFTRLSDTLRDAYARFLDQPVKTDPGCQAKLAIGQALWRLAHDDHEFFLAGLAYRQYEPVFGGEVDTAAELRATCAFALVGLGHPHLIGYLVDLLADREPAARAGAARALAAANRVESEPVLRLKAHLGDERAEVMGECWAGLLRLNADASWPLVAKALRSSDPEWRREAAVALAEARHPQAFRLLVEALAAAHNVEDQRALALALALLRSPTAVDFLLSLVEPGQAELAVAAVEALRHCQDPASFHDRLRSAVTRCDSRYVSRVFAETFPPDDSAESG